QAGDEVLRIVGRLLMREIRSGDLACRYGGEEFTLILPEASVPNAARRAEHIRQALADMIPAGEDGNTYGTVTASFGVAGFPEHGDNAEAVLKAADAALYAAKHAGRNRVELATAPAVSTS
ncbi:MAG: diguanylate cyclase, partial [Chloroflexi bacterium]|nr:diguanylate cyclase [Chloroflexota bacterium]